MKAPGRHKPVKKYGGEIMASGVLALLRDIYSEKYQELHSSYYKKRDEIERRVKDLMEELSEPLQGD